MLNQHKIHRHSITIIIIITKDARYINVIKKVYAQNFTYVKKNIHILLTKMALIEFMSPVFINHCVLQRITTDKNMPKE